MPIILKVLIICVIIIDIAAIVIYIIKETMD